MQRSVPEPVRGDGELYGSAEEGERYDIARDNTARFVVYFGPYILWGSLGALAGLLVLLSG